MKEEVIQSQDTGVDRELIRHIEMFGPYPQVSGKSPTDTQQQMETKCGN